LLPFGKEENSNKPSPMYRSTQTSMAEYSMRSQLTPQILSVLLVAPERMSMFDLFSYIHHLRENHQDTQRYEIALWRKIAYPFAVLVMLSLALPFGYLHTRTGAVGIKVLGGIMLGMSFQLLNTLFSHMGNLKTWPAPIVAVIPSLLYLTLSLLALRWVDRH
jgi:lipopolysaccharide export system permease protein